MNSIYTIISSLSNFKEKIFFQKLCMFVNKNHHGRKSGIEFEPSLSVTHTRNPYHTIASILIISSDGRKSWWSCGISNLDSVDICITSPYNPPGTYLKCHEVQVLSYFQSSRLGPIDRDFIMASLMNIERW